MKSLLTSLIKTLKGGEQLFNNIDVQNFRELAKNKNVIIIDMRTAQELREGYVKGAKHIDFFSGDFKTKLAALDKDKEYLVYCKSGNRSTQGAKIMTGQLEFKKVSNLVGGMGALLRAKYPLAR